MALWQFGQKEKYLPMAEWNVTVSGTFGRNIVGGGGGDGIDLSADTIETKIRPSTSTTMAGGDLFLT